MSKPNVAPLYDDPDADVVLCSRDGVEFRLDKRTLSRSSSIFRDMFTLPSEPSQGETPQVVDVEESAGTLEDLLPFLYPMARPELLELNRLRAVLDAAEKYDIAFLGNELTKNLELFLPSEPLRVYAIAYIREDVKLAQAAARCLLAHPQFAVPPDPPPEFHEIPAIAIWRVHVYRKKCVDAALAVFREEKGILTKPGGWGISMSRKGNADASGSWIWLACRACSQGSMAFALHNSAAGRWGEVNPRAWWQAYFDAVVQRLSARPVGATVQQPELLRATVAEAAKCTKCGPKGAQELYQYAEEMAKKVDDATSKIEIDLPFREVAKEDEPSEDLLG